MDKVNPLGSLLNILFWNDQQRQIYTWLEKMMHTLLLGDYGTGKTLILEAAAKTLSERENTEVLFIMALDYTNHSKESDDILDIMFRKKYEGTKIIFKSIADIREEDGVDLLDQFFPEERPYSIEEKIQSWYLAQHPPDELGPKTSLQLIKSYIESKIIEQNGKELVVIIDELSISEDDKHKLTNYKMWPTPTSELEETLAWLSDNTAMTLASVSSTSLLDREKPDADAAVPQPELDQMITRTGFEAVRLQHIMRSTQNIAAATSLSSVNQAQSAKQILKYPISPGGSSSSHATVPGARPKAFFYQDKDYPDEVDHYRLWRII